MAKRQWFAEIVWDYEDDPDGNVQHIAQHDLTVEEVEWVLKDRKNPTQTSRSSGLPMTFGYTHTGRFIAVVWEEACDNPRLIRPITAYETNPL